MTFVLHPPGWWLGRCVPSPVTDRTRGIHAMGKDNERGVVYGGWMIQGLTVLLVLFARPVAAQEQGVDAALRDRVLQLVERLDDPKPEARDAAQGRLIKLGSKILPLLPEAASVASKDARIAWINSRRSRETERGNQYRGQHGHDPGQGHPALRGASADPEADRQRHHRHARAARRRSDQPLVRSRHQGPDLPRGARRGRQPCRGSDQCLQRRRLDRHHRRNARPRPR